MSEPILLISGLSKRFGGLVVTSGLDLAVKAGELHALIGPNGAGKTTLIAQIQGDLRPDSGDIRFEGRSIIGEPPHRRARAGLARSFQITSVFPEFSALANVFLAAQAQAGHSFRFLRPAMADEPLRQQAMAALEMLGLQDRAGRLAQDLSYGERRLLELAMALAMKPRLLLLDEPMAGVGRKESLLLRDVIAGLKSRYAILLVEHDMDAVSALADKVTVLVQGKAIASGSFDEVRQDERVRAAYLGKKH